MLDGQPIPGDLVDISEGGLLFRCRASIEIADNVRVTLEVWPDKTCTGSGRVVRMASDRGFGVQFEETNDALREFVADIRRLRDELHNDFLSRVVNPMVTVTARAGAQAAG